MVRKRSRVRFSQEALFSLVRASQGCTGGAVESSWGPLSLSDVPITRGRDRSTCSAVPGRARHVQWCRPPGPCRCRAVDMCRSSSADGPPAVERYRSMQRWQTVAVDEELLDGGVANMGGVVRSGAHVLRPANPYSRSIHHFLFALERVGFDGAPVPAGFDPEGRERVTFIDGSVPVPPYPDWAQVDSALTSIADLMRRFHQASEGFDPSGLEWSTELADPKGGAIVCHNDVCLENVVFRDGKAVALIDFDFAAPGRPLFDLAGFARMCVPIDDDINASRLGWHDVDRGARLRLVADSYGLGAAGRAELLRLLDRSIQVGGEFVRRRAEAGDLGFVKMWADMGGQERFDRRRDWWADHRQHIESTVLSTR